MNVRGNGTHRTTTDHTDGVLVYVYLRCLSSNYCVGVPGEMSDLRQGVRVL
jgi:hypothetical protein